MIGFPYRHPAPWASLRGLFAVLALAAALQPGQVAAQTTRSTDGEPPVAVPIEMGRETRRTRVEAPRSKLTPAAALAAARAVAAQVPGSEIFTVLPTGSMRPTFNERAFLVSEPVKYDELQVGDIVTYWHPTRQQAIVHRILEKHAAGYWTKGDYNSRPDDVYVTPDNTKLKRVFAIIYAGADSNTALRGARAAAAR